MSEKDWIQSYSGLKIFPLKPEVEQFRIRDIARALSMQCRYAGHVSRFYSVAEHSVRVSEIVEARAKIDNRLHGSLARWGLMHDASEAYLGDVTRPLKHTPELAGYREAERQMQAAICTWLGLPREEPDLVRAVDTEILGTEARQLKAPVHPDWAKSTATGELAPEIPGLTVGFWSPFEAEDQFLKRFKALFAWYGLGQEWGQEA